MARSRSSAGSRATHRTSDLPIVRRRRSATGNLAVDEVERDLAQLSVLVLRLLDQHVERFVGGDTGGRDDDALGLLDLGAMEQRRLEVLGELPRVPVRPRVSDDDAGLDGERPPDANLRSTEGVV